MGRMNTLKYDRASFIIYMDSTFIPILWDVNLLQKRFIVFIYFILL